jgi:hypothetical protein
VIVLVLLCCASLIKLARCCYKAPRFISSHQTALGGVIVAKTAACFGQVRGGDNYRSCSGTSPIYNSFFPRSIWNVLCIKTFWNSTFICVRIVLWLYGYWCFSAFLCLFPSLVSCFSVSYFIFSFSLHFFFLCLKNIFYLLVLFPTL